MYACMKVCMYCSCSTKSRAPLTASAACHMTVVTAPMFWTNGWLLTLFEAQGKNKRAAPRKGEVGSVFNVLLSVTWSLSFLQKWIKRRRATLHSSTDSPPCLAPEPGSCTQSFPWEASFPLLQTALPPAPTQHHFPPALFSYALY